MLPPCLWGELQADLAQILQKPDGTLENFNKMLVDANQACIWDFDDSEFNPADWWGGLSRQKQVWGQCSAEAGYIKAGEAIIAAQ
jgi:hypothetical protein